MKIYVDVVTPGNGKSYEFQLDDHMTVAQVKAKMIDEIVETEDGNITLKPEKALLCNKNTRTLLNGWEKLAAAGVKSGQELLLF